MNLHHPILPLLIAAALCVGAAAPARAQDAPPAPAPAPATDAKADAIAAKQVVLAFFHAASDERFDDAKALLSPDAIARVEAAMPGASAEQIIGLMELGGPAMDYAAFRPDVRGDVATTTAGIWRAQPVNGVSEAMYKMTLRRVDGAWKIARIAPATVGGELSPGAFALAGKGDETDLEARVARAVSDGRLLHTASAAFMVDHGAYPAWVLGSDEKSASREFASLANMPTFQVNPGLLTPVAYITRHFTDPFSAEKAHYGYYSTEGGFILFSPGPDGDFDLSLEILQAEFRREKGDGTEANFATGSAGMKGNIPGLAPYLYDPTNGLESGGDIARYAMVLK